MKKYHKTTIIAIVVVIICSVFTPALAARDDQTGDCIKKGKCKD